MRTLALAVVALAPLSATAEMAVRHDGVGCVIAERFPELQAQVDPEDAAAVVRVRFRPADGKHWYSVRMEPQAGGFHALLPKPKKSLKGLVYYVEATGRDATTTRTEEFSPIVAQGPAACQDAKVASSVAAGEVLLEVPAGAPAVPAGFAGTGVGAAAAGVAAAAGAAAAGTTAAASGGGVSTALLVGGGVVAAGAATAVVVTQAGGSNEIHLRGYVYEADCTCAQNSPPPYRYRTGNPIQGATVSIPINNASATTDASGFYELRTTDTADTDYLATVTAPNCSSSTYDGGHGTNNPPIHITLQCGNNRSLGCSGLCGS